MEISKIINYCFEKEIMMKEWKQTQTICIDKGDKEKVKPISISPCFSKILERIVNERLIWWTEKQRLLDNWQNGFRRGRSGINNLKSKDGN